MAVTVQSVNEEIRFLLGGLSTTVMPDDTLNKIIQRNIDYYGDDDENFCIITYQSLLDTLQYLINKDAAGAVAGAGGQVIEKEEIVGKRKVRIKYSDDSSGEPVGWQALYDKFIKYPTLVCKSLVPQGGTSSVIIGGVSQKQYDKVATNPDSRNGWAMGSICDRRKYRGWP